MDVWRITLAALRRWYVLLPLLGLTAFLAINVGNSVKPEYQATATIMYIEGTQESELPNPYGSLVGANQVVNIVLNSVETRRALADAGYSAEYEIAGSERNSISTISTRADSLESAEGTGTALIEAARADLVARQGDAGIPEGAQVALQVLEPPTVVTVVQNGKMRIQATIGVIGAALALLAAVLFDDIIGLLKRLRTRRRRAGGQATGDATGDPASATDGILPGPPGSEPKNDSGHTHAVSEVLVHTDQWVWPDEHRPVPSGRPPRNPYFDPEFTKRSLAKLTSAGDGSTRRGVGDGVAHDADRDDTAAPSGTAQLQ